MQISSWTTTPCGVIGIGRITVVASRPTSRSRHRRANGKPRTGKVGQVLGYLGLSRTEVTDAQAGATSSPSPVWARLKISDTICDNSAVEALPPLSLTSRP